MSGMMNYSRGPGPPPRDRDFKRARYGGDFDSDGRFHGGRGGGRNGGRFDGGRGGRSGGRFNNRQPLFDRQLGYRDGVPVQLNMFQLKLNTDPANATDGEWIQYAVEIQDAVRRKKKDENGKTIEPWQFEIVPKKKRDGEDKKVNVDDGSTPLSRRVLMKLQELIYDEEKGIVLVSDGSASAYAPRRIFGASSPGNAAIDGDADSIKAEAAGVYGPADDGDIQNRPQPPNGENRRTYEVKVRQNCGENDPMAERVPCSWFLVTLTEVGKPIPFSTVFNNLANAQNQMEHVQRVSQCVDTMIKSAMMASCIAPSTSPRMFYLPEQYHDGTILGNLLKGLRNSRDFPHVPLVGISQVVRFCQGGQAFIKSDTGVSWFDREFDQEPANRDGERQRPIPLLDDRKKTVAGVYVGNLDLPITDNNIKKEIESAIRKINFHVNYTRKKWIQNQREKGVPEEKIQQKSMFVRRNQRMKGDKDDAAIVWAADDETLHSFEQTFRPRVGPDGETFTPDPVKRTVASYYQEYHGIELRFPKMPIIHTRIGYFPVEFLSQAFGKAKAANSTQQVTQVLGFNDEFSTNKRIKHISNVKRALDRIEEGPRWLRLPDLMRQFNLNCSNEPLKLTAKLLPEPTIEFLDGKAQLNNGSWNFNKRKFSSPADLSSFIMLDFAGNSERFIGELFNTMKGHGMAVPAIFDDRTIRERLIYRADALNHHNPEEVYNAFNNALERAKDFFLHDRARVFENNRDWFSTRMCSQHGDTENCLVVFHRGERTVVLPEDVEASTHTVTNPDTGGQADVRIMALVDRDNMVDGGNPVDLFRLRRAPDRHCHELLVHGNWIPVRFNRFVWCMMKESVMLEESEFTDCRPIHQVEDWQIECPAMAFVFLPKMSPENYHVIKLLSNFRFGVQSQVVVKEKYESQRNSAQYLSNIALKLNTKLFNIRNKARAWGESGQHMEKGIPWVSEVPTMVLGIGLSHGQGQGSKTVIGSSVCLDEFCLPMAQDLRIQSKSDVVAGSTMKDIVKSLAIQFFKHTQKVPERVLVYREGASDSNFGCLVDNELANVRKAFYELNSTKPDFACPNASECQGRGCVFCTPPITFVVCQSDHNIRVTHQDPPPPNNDQKVPNVPSGTCLDHGIMAIENGMRRATIDVEKDKPLGGTAMQLFSCENDLGYDFLLTAQGGLKGTSRPVLYRTVLNENAVWKTSDKATPLTKDNLELCTYHMSYHYGTASKAVRSVPVVHYSKRLANVAQGYLSYLELNGDIAGRSIDNASDATEYVRKDTNEGHLLRGFGPYEERLDSTVNPWRAPFRPHISA